MEYSITVILVCALLVTVTAVPYGNYGGGYGSGLRVPGVVNPGPGTGLPVMPGVNTVPVDPVIPGYGGSQGGNYMNQGYQRGGGGSSGSGYQNQGSGMFYDREQNHSKTKSILETENSSSSVMGASNQGSNSVQSGGNYGNFDNEYLNTGNGYQRGYGYM